MNPTSHITEPEILKTCCATLYESEWARLLLGESFHPGGLALTAQLGELLDLQPNQRVLDVAAGKGTSAVFLAQRFGCEVVGIDYGPGAVAEAAALADEAGLTDRVRFEQGDAESLRFAEATFDAIICECAFCTFPDKSTAAAEFARVLRPGGKVGLSDLTRTGPLPAELEGLLAWIACIADARPVDTYTSFMEEAGLVIDHVEAHDTVLGEMIHAIQTKLLGAELLVKLQKLNLPGADFEQAKALARCAAETVRRGQLGYALIISTKTLSIE
jgi:ubiquinone/menaquinone biosynthesis C-methylase UbiE